MPAGRLSLERSLSRPNLNLALLLAALAVAGCRSKSQSSTGGNGFGERCEANSDCEKSLCVLPDPNTPIGFCTEVCKKQSDCTTDFPDGCCIPTADGQAVCAISALCSHGDAGLGEPCPTQTECVNGLFCLSTPDNTVSECSHTCATTADCEGVAQECCEDLSGGAGTELFCILDPSCTDMPDAGSYDAGPILPGGDDGGPFYAALLVDGSLTADTTAYQGFVGPNGDTLVAPPTSRSIELDLAPTLTPGAWSCDGGGPTFASDAGLTAIVNTGTANPSPGFIDALPTGWQGLTLTFGCGPGTVFGNDALEVQAASIELSAFTAGRVRGPDAGPLHGHATGNAYWRVGRPDGGAGILEIRERFDVDLLPP